MDTYPRKDADLRRMRLGSATHVFPAAEHRLCVHSSSSTADSELALP